MAIHVTTPGSVTLADERRPFDSTDPKYAALLKNLQGNILKSHGRDFAAHIFFRFKPDPAAAKRAIQALRARGYILSAAEQFAQKPADRKAFGSLLLSAKGLKALTLALPAGFGDPPTPGGTPPNPVAMSFSQPMSAAAAHLNDKPAEWDEPYKTGGLDGVMVVAFGNHGPDDQAELHELVGHVQAVKTLLADAVDLAYEEFGHTHVLGGEPREQFGFVDGISQPLFMKSDLLGVSTHPYDPSDGLVHLVVKDPFTDAPDACGSFYVFRKLEQNVKGFREAVARLATDLGVNDELAAGFVVGRFANGDAVELGAAPSGPNPQKPPPNGFDFSSDTTALKCPFQAHIRKTNPRGDVQRIIGTRVGAPPNSLNDGERQVRIARRGITYGDRAADLSDAPESGVGLLFQCYQANIPEQFAFMQQNWANTDNFVQAGPPLTGQDTVIGQGDNTFGTTATTRSAQSWPTAWGGPKTKSLPDFGSYVTMKGGEFFFAPSIPTIEGLHP